MSRLRKLFSGQIFLSLVISMLINAACGEAISPQPTAVSTAFPQSTAAPASSFPPAPRPTSTMTTVPTETSIPSPTPTEVLNAFSLISFEQMRQEVMQGDIDKYAPTSLITLQDIEDHLEDRNPANAESEIAELNRQVVSTLTALDSNPAFQFNLKGVIVGSAFAPVLQGVELNDLNIVFEDRDEAGNPVYTNREGKQVTDTENFGKVDTVGFEGGGTGTFVWGYDGLLRAVLPDRQTDLTAWDFTPDENDSVQVLKGQTYYGRSIILGASGGVWGIAQIDENDNVMAFGGVRGTVDDPDSSWTLAEGVTPLDRSDDPNDGVIGRFLTPEEKRERGIAEDAMVIESTGYVKRLETKFIIVTVSDLFEEIEGIGGEPPIRLNEELERPSAENRLAEIVRLGDYLGWLEDAGLSEEEYTFDQYIDDLINGADRSYIIRCANTGFGLHDVLIDPMKTHELIAIYKENDPIHGKANIGRGVFKEGYVPLPDGSIRFLAAVTQYVLNYQIENTHPELLYRVVGRSALARMVTLLKMLGMDELDQISLRAEDMLDLKRGLNTDANLRITALGGSMLQSDSILENLLLITTPLTK